MLFIMLGEDQFSIHQALEAIKRGPGEATLLAANTVQLDGQHLSLNELGTVCETVPFLAGKRLVIINGLMERFEHRSPARRSRKNQNASGQSDECGAFAGCISRIPDSTVLVLIDTTRIRVNNPLLRALGSNLT